MSLAEKVKIVREKKGWSVSHLSWESRIPQPTIWRIEKGMILEPRAGLLQRLAKALGVTVDYLLGNEQDVSYDQILKNDLMGQAIFRNYEGLNSNDREQVNSFVSWLKEERQKKQEHQGQP